MINGAIVRDTKNDCWWIWWNDRWNGPYYDDGINKPSADWRPIETAPKDGTPILVYDPTGVRCEPWDMLLHVFPAAWGTKEWCACLGTIEGYSYESDSDSWVASLITTPTYWMPLPAPPKEPVPAPPKEPA